MFNFRLFTLKRSGLTVICLGLMIALSACSLLPAPADPQTGAVNDAQPVVVGQAAATESPTNTPRPATPTNPPARATNASAALEATELFAILGDLTDTVTVKPEGESKAHDGVFSEHLAQGSELSTDETGRARLLFSDGTTVRMATNTEMTLATREFDEDDNPIVNLGLAIGKLWTILIDGELSVETPIGVGSVRGSFMSVEYIPGDPNTLEDDILIVTCLEGTCSLSNGAGSLALISGQKGSITGQDNPPAGPFAMTFEDIINWLDNNPEILILFFQGDVPDLSIFGDRVIVITLADGSTVILVPPGGGDGGTDGTDGGDGSTLPTAPAPGAATWSNSVASNRPAGWLLLAGGLVLGVASRNWLRRK